MDQAAAWQYSFRAAICTACTATIQKLKITAIAAAYV